MSDPSVSKNKTKSKISRSGLPKCVIWTGGIVAFLIAAFPILLSELFGGWTAPYTSPIQFTPDDIPDLTDQVVIVTGANTGIGYITALELAKKNAHVIVAARSAKKGQSAVDRIQIASKNNNVEFLALDLSSLASVQAFAKSFQALKLPLHRLILNAGIMKSPGALLIGKNMTYGFEMTDDGFESHIGVNHVGHFYLTKLLTSNLIESAPSRVVSVSSIASDLAFANEGILFHTWRPASKEAAMLAGYEDGLAYGQSKLANILFARELSVQLQDKGVTAYSCHPGVILSDLSRYMDSYMIDEAKKAGWLQQTLQTAAGRYVETMQMDVETGALTQLHLAVADPNSLTNGAFYKPVGRMAGGGGHPMGNSNALQKEVWAKTEQMIKDLGF